MECNEFSRKDLETYASSWGYEMGQDLWQRIWDHARSCPSCSAVIRQSYENRRSEEKICRERFPGLAAIADAIFDNRWIHYNWREKWFKEARRRKLYVRSLTK